MASSEGVCALIYYENKDYERECDALEMIFANFSTKKIKRILDVGCGTGSHALLLSVGSIKLLESRSIESNG